MRTCTGLRGINAFRAIRAFRAIHTLRVFGAMMLLGIWCLNPSLYFLKSLIGQANGMSGMSSIAANSIQAPQQEKEICHHHPHGCPKDCFCPKIHPDEAGAPDMSGDITGDVSVDLAAKRESIHQPILVQCTEDNAAAGPPAGVIALAVPIREIRMPTCVLGRCPDLLIPSLLETPQEPPPKIPIA